MIKNKKYLILLFLIGILIITVSLYGISNRKSSKDKYLIGDNIKLKNPNNQLEYTVYVGVPFKVDHLNIKDLNNNFYSYKDSYIAKESGEFIFEDVNIRIFVHNNSFVDYIIILLYFILIGIFCYKFYYKGIK